MKLTFKKIEIHNFMSFSDEIFNFEEYPGLTLVKGKNNDIPGSRNGVGKSVTFEALLFGLFGQLHEKIKNENIVNRYSSDKDMRLAIYLSVDDVDYKVVRGITKGKSSYFNLYRIDDGNDIDMTKSSIAETQSFLENDIIHCDISIFLRTILLTADQTYNFYKLKKADKKDFVEKLFDISVFGDMHTLMHKDVLSLEKEISSHQNRLLVLNKNLVDYDSRMKVYDENHKIAINECKAKLIDYKTKHDKLKALVVEDNSESVAKYTAALVKIDSAITENSAAIRNCESSKSALVIKMNKLLSTKDSKLSIIAKHSDVMAKLCSDCKPIFAKHYDLDTIQADISTIDATVSELSTKITESDVTIKTYSDKGQTLISTKQKALDKISKLTEKSTKVESAVVEIETKIRSAKSDLSRLKSDINPYSEMLSECQKSVEIESTTLANLEIKYNYIKFAEGIVSQETLRKLIIKDLIILLNNRVKTYLTKLGAKYYVKFDEDMDYEFITEGGSCEFGNFSAGEKMRTMIATSFAFRDFMSIRNGLNSNILVLDEYFDTAIDSLCVGSILSILKEYNSLMNQNIFVISHRTEVSDDEFNNIMQVEKTNNISTVSKLK